MKRSFNYTLLMTREPPKISQSSLGVVKLIDLELEYAIFNPDIFLNASYWNEFV